MRPRPVLVTLALVVSLLAAPAAVADSLPTMLAPCQKKPKSGQCFRALAGYAFGSTKALSEKDTGLTDEIGTILPKWNSTATPLMQSYKDPKVTAAEYVRLARAAQPKLRGYVDGMESRSQKIQDDATHALFTSIAGNYRQRLNSFELLLNMVAAGDVVQEKVAFKQLLPELEAARLLVRPMTQRLQALEASKDVGAEFRKVIVYFDKGQQ